jgi:cytochrome c2
MPKFNVTDAEASMLADYVLAVYQTPAFNQESAPSTSADVEHGKELFYGKYACQACHIVDPDQDKGYIGPTLTQVGARLTASWIFHWLKNSQRLRPGSMEPVWDMNDEDAHAVTAFLAAQKSMPRKGVTKK